mmetsp:Transcript_7897/g.22732  ORF Transcript_7897/g.22732 Transcript_7897/m.22732 type:complete len:796 (-) Transcript_7897:87-2474(-)
MSLHSRLDASVARLGERASSLPLRLPAQSLTLARWWRKRSPFRSIAMAALACAIFRALWHVYKLRAMRLPLPPRVRGMLKWRSGASLSSNSSQDSAKSASSSCDSKAGYIGRFSRPGDATVGSEPRATEESAPWVMKSRIIRHRSVFDVYDIDDGGSALGEGLNGKVLRGVHRTTGRTVAMKRLKTRPSRGSLGPALPEELSIYARMSHPNICRLLEAYIEQNGDCWLSMEHCRGGDLFEKVAGCAHAGSGAASGVGFCATEWQVASLVRQMAAAFRYIHGMGIVHRDNKLENWVFASPAQERIKLIDFGFATLAPIAPHERRLTHVCGTCYYVAPEVLSVKRHKLVEGAGYGAEVDIWALGVILYMLISGTAPFTAEQEQDILWEIAAPSDDARLVRGPFSGSRWSNVSPECIDLIKGCLTRDPFERLTAAEVQAHPWLEPQLRADQRGHLAFQPCLKPVLEDLLRAGSRVRDNRLLAYFCGHMAQRIHLPPELWSECRDIFFSLEGANASTPRGAVYLEELVSECLARSDLDLVSLIESCSSTTMPWSDETDTASAGSDGCPEALAGGASSAAASLEDNDQARRIRELISCLDLTGDGRLHFCEFFGALIASGRIKVRRCDVESAFEAFDVDRDGVISQADVAAIVGDRFCALESWRLVEGLSGGALRLPVSSVDAVLDFLGVASSDRVEHVERPLTGLFVKPCRRATSPNLLSPSLGSGSLPQAREGGSPAASPSCRGSSLGVLTPIVPQRLLSKCEALVPWTVERKVALTECDIRRRISFPSTPNPSGGRG